MDKFRGQEFVKKLNPPPEKNILKKVQTTTKVDDFLIKYESHDLYQRKNTIDVCFGMPGGGSLAMYNSNRQ